MIVGKGIRGMDEQQVQDALRLADACVAAMRAWEVVAEKPGDVAAAQRAELAATRRRELVEAYALRWC